jgi:hypothetical protein
MNTQAAMEWVLEHACRELPHYGGDHESRKYIALRLIERAESGGTSLADFETVARQALKELSGRKSA